MILSGLISATLVQRACSFICVWNMKWSLMILLMCWTWIDMEWSLMLILMCLTWNDPCRYFLCVWHEMIPLDTSYMFDMKWFLSSFLCVRHELIHYADFHACNAKLIRNYLHQPRTRRCLVTPSHPYSWRTLLRVWGSCCVCVRGRRGLWVQSPGHGSSGQRTRGTQVENTLSRHFPDTHAESVFFLDAIDFIALVSKRSGRSHR